MVFDNGEKYKRAEQSVAGNQRRHIKVQASAARRRGIREYR